MQQKPICTALVLAWLAACVTSPEPQPAPESAPPETVEPEAKHVSADLAVIASDGFCLDLHDEEQLWSVSPEGHAWFATSGNGAQNLRVVDPFEPTAELLASIELGSLRKVHAWSKSDAAVITDDGLWRLDDLARIQLVSPIAPTSISAWCGDPSRDGMLLANGQLYELRDAIWWQWDAETEDKTTPSSIVSLDGECLSTDNVTWLMSDDGTLWKLDPAAYSLPKQFEAGASAAATAGFVAALESKQLWIGPDNWQPYVFDGAVPTALSASGGLLWLGAGEQLLRFDGNSFVEVAHELEQPITSITAHASGTWVVGEDKACHVTTMPMLRIAGIRPYRRSTELDYEVAFSASDETLSVTASVDGTPIDLSLDETTGWMTGSVSLDGIGWNSIVLQTEGAARTVPVKRLPTVERSWESDIQPIYEDNCASSICHSSSAEETPNLGSYEMWLQYADAIELRVVEAQTMPPPSAQGADWSEEQVSIITEWLEGGMLP